MVVYVEVAVRASQLDPKTLRSTKRNTFSASEIGRDDVACSTPRQRRFESDLRVIADVYPGGRIPVFIRCAGTADDKRLDLGRIGHAIANGVLQYPSDNEEGFVDTLDFVWR